VFYREKPKAQKYSILVIRVGKDNKLVNARPCYKCLEMLKVCNIKKVYYSTPEGIVCERVKNMVSINASSISRYIEKKLYNAPQDDTEYYKRLLKQKFPKEINRSNLNYFLEYNLNNVLPHFKYKITKYKIIFYDSNNIFILSSIIYE
jgi:hypothetical protein